MGFRPKAGGMKTGQSNSSNENGAKVRTVYFSSLAGELTTLQHGSLANLTLHESWRMRLIPCPGCQYRGID